MECRRRVSLANQVRDHELRVSVHADEHVLVAALRRIVVGNEGLLLEDVSLDFVHLDATSRNAPDFGVQQRRAPFADFQQCPRNSIALHSNHSGRGSHRATLDESVDDLDLFFYWKDIHFGLPFPRGEPIMFLRSALRLTPRADLAPFSVSAEGGAFSFRPRIQEPLAVCQALILCPSPTT